MVISDAETFVGPPNRRHAGAKETKETRVVGTVKRAKGRGEDLRSPRQLMSAERKKRREKTKQNTCGCVDTL